MDSARYSRIRDLFWAAEEMPPGEREAFLSKEAGTDVELLEEVVSLLAEHDPVAARKEGQFAQQAQLPSIGSVMPFSEAADPDSGTSTSRDTSEEKKTTSAAAASDQDTPNPSRRSEGSSAREKRPELITQQGALRTHASPRYSKSKPQRQTSSTVPIWTARTRKQRRRNSGWLWLAALLPTALIGFWTYRGVSIAMQESVRTNLDGAAENLSLSTARFLSDQAALVESWSRQPNLRQSIQELVELSASDPPVEELRSAPQISRIHLQLQELSGNDSIKFVVWNTSYRTVASWLPNREDVGNPVHPSGASNLARVMAGETVIFGPERLVETSKGFVPETQAPVMAVIVPIEDSQGRISAAILVRGFSMFKEFDRLFSEMSLALGVDAYAIDRDGVMSTTSVLARSIAGRGEFDLGVDEIASTLRVSDPGLVITRENADQVRRSLCPVTIAVAGATSKNADTRTQPYSNYAGQSVVGAWRWIEPWQVGVIVEQDASLAFAPARLVSLGFLVLGILLSVTAFLAAAKIARISTAEQAAVHPLNRYEVLGELGSGGMGVVYRARHRQLGRDVALKVLRGDRHGREDRLRFDREAKLAASLRSPHSVMIYDYGHSAEGEAYCVMQFLEGLTLQEVVARSGYQAVGRVLSIIRQICDALAEAHATNLLHRDIKPQNVMVSLDPSVGDWTIVFDYGLAKPLQPDANVYQTSETIWAGTPMYMAPERFRDPANMDPRSDIYSVGCVAYYLLAGRPPFIESDPESLFSLILSEQPIGIGIHRGEEIDSEISKLVFKCMAKRVEDRFASVAELGRAIDLVRSKHVWTMDQARVWWSHHGGR